jgi:hypothetical protein
MQAWRYISTHSLCTEQVWSNGNALDSCFGGLDLSPVRNTGYPETFCGFIQFLPANYTMYCY